MNPDPLQLPDDDNLAASYGRPSFRRGCLLIAGWIALGLALGFLAGRALA